MKPHSDQLFECYIKGNAFLYHQIRCMIAVLTLLINNKVTKAQVEDMMDPEKTPTKPFYQMAPPELLQFMGVEYPDEWKLDFFGNLKEQNTSRDLKRFGERQAVLLSSTAMFEQGDFGGWFLDEIAADDKRLFKDVLKK